MRFPFFLSAAAFSVFSISLVSASVQVQAVFARAETHTSDNSDGPTRPVKATATEKVLLIGKITNPAGVLPGAVVTLTATKQMAVTNADGEFQFEVPANVGALDAVVTYAGYADEKMTLNAAAAESTTNLANTRVIVVARRQQLKFYLKSARKQVKRSIKQVHK